MSALPEGAPSWIACEHPERPPDAGMGYHLGFLRPGGGGPCIGCAVVAQARAATGDGSGRIALIVSAHSDDVLDP